MLPEEALADDSGDEGAFGGRATDAAQLRIGGVEDVDGAEVLSLRM
jgi:hypothetical protein